MFSAYLIMTSEEPNTYSLWKNNATLWPHFSLITYDCFAHNKVQTDDLLTYYTIYTVVIKTSISLLSIFYY